MLETARGRSLAEKPGRLCDTFQPPPDRRERESTSPSPARLDAYSKIPGAARSESREPSREALRPRPGRPEPGRSLPGSPGSTRARGFREPDHRGSCVLCRGSLRPRRDRRGTGRFPPDRPGSRRGQAFPAPAPPESRGPGRGALRPPRARLARGPVRRDAPGSPHDRGFLGRTPRRSPALLCGKSRRPKAAAGLFDDSSLRQVGGIREPSIRGATGCVPRLSIGARGGELSEACRRHLACSRVPAARFS